VLGLPFLLSRFAVVRRVRAVLAAPEGRWKVTPGQVAALLDWQEKGGAVNEWHPTRAERANGFEVCWTGEHLVVGGHYLYVAPGQMLPFTAVRCRVAPPAHVSLHYRQPWHQNMASVTRFVMTDREFAFPVPDELQARAFHTHFERRLRGENTLQRRRRLRRLSNWALGAGAVCALMLAVSFGVAWHDREKGIFRPTPHRAVLIGMMTFGLMGAPILLVAGVSLRRNRD
jgi:hypothetical protein